MLTQDLETLFAILHSPNADEDACNRALSTFMGEVAQTSDREELWSAGKKLAEVFDWADLDRAYLVAIVCGALVESGFPPAPLATAIAQRLSVWTNDVARFHTRLIAQTGTLPEDEDGAYEARLGATFEALSAEMPQEFESWNRLQAFYLPIVSVLCAEPATRAKLAPLRSLLAELEEEHEGALWISKLLGVFDNATLLVIEPATKRGFVGLMSGIADNFQLHALLLAAWSEIDGEHRLSASAKALFEGQGEPESNETVTSHWNLFNWEALGEHGALPSGMEGSSHWIWNEGTPGDISVFDGFRVVLIGEPLYERSWSASRAFAALSARIQVEHVLTLGETVAWLSRLSAAPR